MPFQNVYFCVFLLTPVLTEQIPSYDSTFISRDIKSCRKRNSTSPTMSRHIGNFYVTSARKLKLNNDFSCSGPVHTNPFSKTLRTRLSSILQRRKRSPKAEMSFIYIFPTVVQMEKNLCCLLSPRSTYRLRKPIE